MKSKHLKAFSLKLDIENEILKLRAQVRKNFDTSIYKRIFDLENRKKRVNNFITSLNQ